MATKNLARTVIEGGRTGHYQAEVDINERAERRAVKRFCGKVANDIEEYEDLVVPKRQPVYPDFADKLTPAYRFLDSHLGEPWDDIRSILFSRFDIRTTPGRHVLFDHVLRDVRTGPAVGYDRWTRYYVNDEGLLQKKKEQRGTNYKVKPIPYATITRWLGHRKIGRCGERLVWFVPTRDADRVKAVWGPRTYAKKVTAFQNDLVYVALDAKGAVILRELPPQLRTLWFSATHEEVRSTVSYRPERLLSPNEGALFRSFPQTAQKAILACAPQKQAA
jgi:hypothetical protein